MDHDVQWLLILVFISQGTSSRYIITADLLWVGATINWCLFFKFKFYYIWTLCFPYYLLRMNVKVVLHLPSLLDSSWPIFLASILGCQVSVLLMLQYRLSNIRRFRSWLISEISFAAIHNYQNIDFVNFYYFVCSSKKNHSPKVQLDNNLGKKTLNNFWKPKHGQTFQILCLKLSTVQHFTWADQIIWFVVFMCNIIWNRNIKHVGAW